MVKHDEACLRRLGCLLLFALLTPGAAAAARPTTAPWTDARQLVVVVTPDWHADHGELRTFVRGRDGWRLEHAAAAVTIGEAGAAWGLGLNPAQHDGPVKREGDGRSPAGVFRIGEAFGYAASAATAMPYRALSATDYCVDVSGAAQYNRIVDAKVVGTAAVRGSTEPMRRDLHFHGDQHYRLGFVIEQNPHNQPQGGSCIFAHLWDSPSDATVGCTAMPAALMQSLLAWLEPKQNPVFVLLPRAEYLRLQATWKLPAL